MPKKWVVNASPLIILGKIGLLELLPSLAEELVIPEGVKAEIEAGPFDDPAHRWLIDSGKRFVRNVGPIEPTVLYWDLGRGETEVLSWAHHNPEFEAILDDQAARRCALSLGINIQRIYPFNPWNSIKIFIRRKEIF